MVRSKFHIAIILLFVIFLGCEKKTNITNIQNQWSGLNPTSIPLGIRLKEIQKGNLITNPSFELGRHYTIDSTNLSFNLPGWRKLGDNVIWTNTENSIEFDEEDASNGIHAIKIERETSDETEVQGEGVITDYIKVIPGNYQLSFDIRLSNIRSNLHRLGTGVYDAVNIRVFCYDRNKVMIKNVGIHPLYNKEIDNSFKGFTFSNHRVIDELKWSRVFGRSGNFPFEEGNLPEETRYVKIFAGLKGEGRMWLDKFDFRYSPKNFTLLEQLEPYFDTTLQRSAYLIPAPQKAEYYKNMQLIHSLENEEQVLPRILLPVNSNKQLTGILRAFNQSLGIGQPGKNGGLPVVSRISAAELESVPIIISIGNNNLSNQFSDQLPFDEITAKNQAYFIKRLPQLNNLVFIGYSDIEGLRHALHTLKQLMDFRNNIYHHYDIVDFPDFHYRGVITGAEGFDNNKSEFIDGFQLLSSLGINTWILESESIELGSDDVFKNLQEWKKIDLSFFNYPYIRKGVSLENLKVPSFPVGNLREQDQEMLKYEELLLSSSEKLYENLVNLKENNIDLVLFSDKTLWESMYGGSAGSININQESFDKFMFYRDLFAGRLTDNDLSRLPVTYLIPFFADVRNQSGLFSEIYSQALTDSSTSQWLNKVLWPGPVKNASLIDAMDLFGYNESSNISYIDHSLTYETESSYYGNYYNLYPGKALSGVIFKPFDTHITGISPEDLNSEVFMKLNDFSEVSLIRVSTAVDYFWNNSLYDPAFSLWKALIYSYGEDLAREIVLFNDLYYKLLSISLDMDLNGYNQRLDKQGEELIIQLNNHWDQIKIILSEHITFLNELSDLKNSIISRFYLSQKNSRNDQE